MLVHFQLVKEEPCGDESSSKMETDVKTEASSGGSSTSESVSPKVKEEVGVTAESTTPAEKTEATSAPEVKRKEFTIDEMRQSLWPVLQHIIGQPETLTGGWWGVELEAGMVTLGNTAVQIKFQHIKMQKEDWIN